MNSREIRKSIQEGKLVCGTIISAVSPRWPLEVSKAGLDFVFIDTEHIAMDRETMAAMCLTYKYYNLAPFVRIPTFDPDEALRALDGGASGVIAPYVETAGQARALAGAVKYRPLKGKKLDDILNGRAKCEDELAAYLQDRNDSNFLIVMIESVPGLDALDEILKVPGLDAILVGPHDLSCSLGVPEQYQSPAFKNAISQVIRKCRADHIAVGIHFSTDLNQEIEWIREGANIIMHSADFKIFAEHMRRDLQRIKEESAWKRP